MDFHGSALVGVLATRSAFQCVLAPKSTLTCVLAPRKYTLACVNIQEGFLVLFGFQQADYVGIFVEFGFAFYIQHPNRAPHMWRSVGDSTCSLPPVIAKSMANSQCVKIAILPAWESFSHLHHQHTKSPVH